MWYTTLHMALLYAYFYKLHAPEVKLSMTRCNGLWFVKEI